MKRIVFLLLSAAVLLVSVSCHHEKAEKKREVYDPYKDAPGRVVKTTYPKTNIPCDVYIYKVDEKGHRTDELLCHAGYHKNGSLYAEKKYQNGIAEGIWNAYYDDGTLWSTETFRNGLQVGEEKTFYENGKPHTYATYNNGVIDGEERVYFENGKLQLSRHYQMGVLHGDFKQYYQNGQLACTGHYTDGNCDGVWTRYNEQGVKDKEMTADANTVVCGNCPKCVALRKTKLKKN